jgi:hypothetical protein
MSGPRCRWFSVSSGRPGVVVTRWVKPAAGADRAELGWVADQDDDRVGLGRVVQESFGVAGGDLAGFVDEQHRAGTPHGGRVWGVVEQGEPAGHHPGGDAEPVVEFFGLPAAVRGAEREVCGGGQRVHHRSQGLGLAGTGRSDHHPHTVAAAEDPLDQLSLLP